MKLFALVILAPLAACVDASAPVVTDYNGHLVKVQGRIYALNGPNQNPKDYPEYQVAVDTCALDGRKAVRYQGFRMSSEYTGEHVFLCS